MRLIDADELLEELDRHAFDFGLDDLHMLEDVINDMLTIEERRNGHWNYSRRGGHQCSRCNRSSKNGSPFCQWCGAIMDEVSENEKI